MDLAAWAGTLAMSVERGVPLVHAVRLAALTTPDAAAMEPVVVAVADGATLADAMARHPRLFPADMTALVTAGESSGRLG